MLNKLTALLAFVGVVSAAAITTTSSCDANNCYRQVKASAFPSRSTSADCSRYQTTTSAVVTITSTTTVFSAAATSSSGIPAYASSCSNDAQFRSACSCLGFSSTVVSVPTRTVTATKVCSTITIQAADGPNVGHYFQSEGGTEYLDALIPTSAQQFEFRNGRLYEPGSPTNLANADATAVSGIYLDSNYGPLAGGASTYAPLNCVIGANDVLSCHVEGGTSNTFQTVDAVVDNTRVFFAPGRFDTYNVFTAKAIPVCPA